MAKIELEGELEPMECDWPPGLHVLLFEGAPLAEAFDKLTMYTYVGDTYGRCRITIEQIEDVKGDGVAQD